MITIDTSGLLAAIGEEDPFHRDVADVLANDPGPYIVPVAALGEMAYMLETVFPVRIEHAFINDLQSDSYRLGCGDPDLRRIEELTRKYADLPLGLTDAAIISCAEQHGGRVLTLDRRHFDVVARGERTLTVLPSSSPG